MLSFSLLGSGSSGNAALIRGGGATVLLDCGLSYRALSARAEALGVGLETLTAVLVTHEHGDHVASLGTLCRKYGVPVYLTEGTRDHLPEKVGALPAPQLFESGDVWSLGGIEVASFGVSHDAADPVGYTFRAGGAKLGFATDVGHPSQLVRRRLAGCNALVIESNYCPGLLRAGGYPAHVQQRIRSRTGHLSNVDTARLLGEVRHDGLRTVVLVHLSENNNRPERAMALAAGALGAGPQLVIAPRDAATGWIEVRP